MQNSKNHEEEVQLRLKFESKLNNMHSLHRDLETKYNRALKEIENQMADKDEFKSKYDIVAEENAVLKKAKMELESKL